MEGACGSTVTGGMMRCGGRATMTRTKTVGEQDEAWYVWHAADPAQPSQQDLQGAQEAGVAGPRLSPSQPSQRVDTDGGLTEEGVVQATVKKKRRYKPGTVALREIRKYEAKLTHRSLWSHTLSGQLHCVRMCMTHTVPSYTCTHADHGHN